MLSFNTEGEESFQKPEEKQSNPHSEQELKVEPQSKESQADLKNTFWTLKVKILVGVLVFLALLGIGLGIGLYFRFRTTIQPLGPTTIINVGNGTYYAMGQFELKQGDLFGNDTKVKLMLTQAVHLETHQNQPPASRLLQEESSNQPETSDFSAHANLNEVGVQLSFSSSSDLAIRVDLQNMLDYLEKTDTEVSRLLNEADTITGEGQILSQAEVVSELQSAFSNALSDQVVNSSSLEFKEIPIVNFVFNNETQSYEAANFDAVTNATRRMLMVRQLGLGRLKKIAKSFAKVATKVVKPVVNVIRKHGPLVGGVAGALVGGVVGAFGGPLGVFGGMKAGYILGTKVGIAAQALVRACVPQDKLTIRCEKNAVINAGAGAAFEYAKMKISDKVTDKALKTCGAPCDKAINAVAKLLG